VSPADKPIRWSTAAATVRVAAGAAVVSIEYTHALPVGVTVVRRLLACWITLRGERSETRAQVPPIWTTA
jgi:hypothetical protein